MTIASHSKWRYTLNGGSAPHVIVGLDRSSVSSELKGKLEDMGVQYQIRWAEDSKPDSVLGNSVPFLEIPSEDHVMFRGMGEIEAFFLRRFEPI